MKKWYLIIVVSVLNLLVYGQNEPAYLGLYHNSNKGQGFSHTISGDCLGLRVVRIPMKSGGKMVFQGIGLSGICLIESNQYLDVFGYVGGQLIQTNLFEKSSNFNTSYGLGFTTKLGQGVNVSTSAGYGHSNSFKLSAESLVSGELGIHYHF